VSLPGIDSFNGKIKEIKCEDDIASDVSITVFVVCANLNSDIDLKLLVDLYHKDNDGSFTLVYKPNSKKSKKVKKRGEDSFYNSLQVESKISGNNVSCKIFPNGKLHIAGCKTIEMCHRVLLVLRNFVYEYKESIKSLPLFVLTDEKFGMINSQFKFKTNINQTVLKDIINENTWIDNGNWRFATYQPSKYHGINAKFWTKETADKWRKWNELPEKDRVPKKIPKKVPGQVAVLIFRSGITIITGAKNEKEIKEAYDCITSLVRNNISCQKQEIEDVDNSDSEYSDSDDDF
jgi:TATA-box binding protein (TBP) (component of TFIID and TFIIIB)